MFFNRNATFRPKKIHDKGSKRQELHKHAKATLGSGDVRAAVCLPKNEDMNEWLAANTIDIYNEVSLVYGAIIQHCTEEKCPEMGAGPKFQYLWKDDKNYKTPTKLAAPIYIHQLMSWIEEQLNNESIFPFRNGSFPRGFLNTIKNIFRRLFRVYAHIYYSHFEKFVNLGAEAHLNSCFKHFILFVKEFQLMEIREMEPLQELIDNLTR